MSQKPREEIILRMRIWSTAVTIAKLRYSFILRSVLVIEPGGLLAITKHDVLIVRRYEN